MLKQDREHTHTHKIPTYCSHSFRPSACYFEKPATCSSTTGRHFFFKMCGLRSSALLWSCGRPCIRGLYLPHQGHYSSLSPSFSRTFAVLHTQKTQCLFVYLSLSLSFRCCVWFECVLLKMQHVSLFQPQPTSCLFSLFLSVSSFHFPHR